MSVFPDAYSVMFIPLSRGKFATIDSTDYPLIAGYRWCAEHRPRTGKWYATAYVKGSYRNKTTARISMHRVIAQPDALMDVDHHDNDGLNNRRGNLRPCSRTLNHANRHHIASSSGFKGVSWNKRYCRYHVNVCFDRKKEFVGSFTDPVVAAKAYDKRAVERFGEFAHLNFPEEARRGAKRAAVS